MIVTELVPAGSAKKYKVCVDEDDSFVLYKGEIRRYGIEAGQELSKEVYEEILEEVLLKRGKARALHLLQSMDRTEQQLCRKLQEGGYPSRVTEQVIAYVKDCRYIDDARYAACYVRSKRTSKSVLQIRMELRAKGVADEIVDAALAEEEAGDEGAIRRWIEKKKIDGGTDAGELRRFFAFMQRKGFQYEDVQRALKTCTNYEAF